MGSVGLSFRLAFPAHAGMNRRLALGLHLETRVPRACGDEPVVEHDGYALQ